MSRFAKVVAAASALALAFGLSACSAGGNEGTPGVDRPVRIGVTNASDPYWEHYKEATKAQGIEVELVDFAEYSQPNPALAAGEIDLNEFQHLIYLAQYNVSAGDDLTPIGATAIYPLGLYSQTYKSTDEIPAGSEIAIPNDESNQARALLVLQQAGLLKLKDGGSPFSSPDDIIAAESKVTVRPIEASLTGTTLPDVAGSVINQNFLDEAGLKPTDAIAQDDPNADTAKPYINVFVSRAEGKDNPTYLKLVEIFQNDKATTDGLVEHANGAAEPLTTPTAELLEVLQKTQADYEKAGK